MKLLITGLPGSGKSTLLSKLIRGYDGTTLGFITREIKMDGKRMGFEVVASSGRRAILAQTEAETDLTVGRFYVNPESMDDVLSSVSDMNAVDLLYIDEIGQMQLLSPGFRSLLSRYVDSEKPILASVSSVYESDEIKSVVTRPDSLLFTLTQQNRGDIERVINAALSNISYFGKLPEPVKIKGVEIAKFYIQEERFVSLRKLFNNAIHYFGEGRVSAHSKTGFAVKGHHASHEVKVRSANKWSCDCALASGQEPYRNASECSHYQAVLLFLADSGSV